MHLVIVSTPRAGAHMLRSMLRADPRVDDIGAFIQPDDGRHVEPPRSGAYNDVRAVYERELAARPGQLLLSHIKLMHGHFDAIGAAAATGGVFLFLTRRDHLAQACSLLLAVQTGSLTASAPKGATIRPKPQVVADFMSTLSRLEQLGRRFLEGLPHVALVYEDIGVSSVKASLLSLGLDVDAGEPTTVKSAPRLADYVTNLAELI